MADPTGGLPSGVNPSVPEISNDSSIGADRAAAIEAEKKKWRDKLAKENELPTDDVVLPTDEIVDDDDYFDE